MKEVGGLRMWILHVIDENGSSNGIEIMDSVQKHYDLQYPKLREQFIMQHGHHRDNHVHPHHKGNKKSKRLLPGSVYPMLKKMVSEGLIIKQDDGKYDLTEDGQILISNLFEHFQSRNENLDHKPISIENSLGEMNWQISYMEDIDKDKIIPHKESIKLLIERLKKIDEQLK
jgi:DNA-binding PadR family transcriptional regulator